MINKKYINIFLIFFIEIIMFVEYSKITSEINFFGFLSYSFTNFEFIFFIIIFFLLISSWNNYKNFNRYPVILKLKCKRVWLNKIFGELLITNLKNLAFFVLGAVALGVFSKGFFSSQIISITNSSSELVKEVNIIVVALIVVILFFLIMLFLQVAITAILIFFESINMAIIFILTIISLEKVILYFELNSKIKFTLYSMLTFHQNIIISFLFLVISISIIYFLGKQEVIKKDIK
ncbi:MAG: hypothetical protein ACRDD2_06705 [Sarcina sp.]